MQNRKHLQTVREGASEAKPLGTVWVVSTRPLEAAGLEKALERRATVHVGARPPEAGLSCVIFCTDGRAASLPSDLKRVRELGQGVPLLVFGPNLDLALAQAALNFGADGFVHAAMEREQVVRAVEVAQKGELVAPRGLLQFLISQNKSPDLEDLSTRQREILGLVAERLSNAEIAKSLYLSESTVKQHLRIAYKVLGVHNRTEAVRVLASIDDNTGRGSFK
jgi:DNA-binding NarL/FixJ family response regulator